MNHIDLLIQRITEVVNLETQETRLPPAEGHLKKVLLEALGLKWTTVRPTTPGWYWHRRWSGDLNDALIQVVEVHHWDSGVWISEAGSEDPQRLREMLGEWAGPLIPPP